MNETWKNQSALNERACRIENELFNPQSRCFMVKEKKASSFRQIIDSPMNMFMLGVLVGFSLLVFIK